MKNNTLFLVLSVMVLCLGIFTFNAPMASSGAPVPSVMISDGSDPMPLCRPGHNGCPVKPPQVARLVLAGGGGCWRPTHDGPKWFPVCPPSLTDGTPLLLG